MSVDEPIIKRRPSGDARIRMQWSLLIFTLLAIALIIALAWFIFMRQDTGYILRTYKYTQVKTRTFVERLAMSGTVVPARMLLVKAPVGGRVEVLNVGAGDEVKEGELVAKISAPDLEDEKTKAERELADAELKVNQLTFDLEYSARTSEHELRMAEKKVEEARQTLELKEAQYELGTISRKELEDAKEAVAEAEAAREIKAFQVANMKSKAQMELDFAKRQVKIASEKLAEIEDALASTLIKAPINGKVLEVNVFTGEVIAQGSKLLTVADMRDVMVIAMVDELKVNRLKVDQAVTIRLPDRTYDGRVRYIAPQASSEGGQAPAVEVHVEFNEVPDNLRANSTVNLDVEVGRKEGALFLPRGPYLTSGEYSFVYVIDGDKARRREVSFGLIEGNYVEVVHGLEVGEMVITSSYEDFKDRSEIRLNLEGGRGE